MVKILIFGDGFIGNHLHNYFEGSIISKRRIESIRDIINEVAFYEPDLVINAIGKTGKPNVDWCEDHKLETMFGNVTVPLMINHVCQEQDLRFVHIGSGCVYAEGPWTEKDEPNFYGSFYSRTKLYSEKLLNEFEVLQLRIRMPIDGVPSNKNLITKLTKYGKIINMPNSVTCIPDLLSITKQLIDKKATGIYNVVNKNPILHSEILDMYKEIVDSTFEYTIINLKDLYKFVKAKRSNCVLETSKLEDEGIKVTDSKRAIRECLIEYKKHVGA